MAQNGTNGSDKVCVGMIAGAHGVRGLVKLKSFTEDPADIAAYGPLSDEHGRRSFRIALQSEAKGMFIARIDGVADRDAAEALNGTRLYIGRDRLPALEDEDDFYHADLIGLRADLPDGSGLGTVKAVFDYGSGDVLEIAKRDGGSVLVPFTKAAVPVVDIAGRRVVVEPLPGLFEGRTVEQEAEAEGEGAP
ncbi:MAG TPA: ribosome maturation factor RimM [Alphaproteobacteria bacterium]|nr:ribosome maturation factor RimM [Alphaproteobacteria bacterium]